MRSLFDDERQPEPKEQSVETTETLEELAREKELRFWELAELAETQRELVSKARAVEREAKQILEGVEEHVVPDGRDLTHEDVEKWVRSTHQQFARTMPGNPHAYRHVRWCDEGMFYRVVEFIREHGYEQEYGGAVYVCYDAAGWFHWSMGSPIPETILINCKPISMKPGRRPWAKEDE